MPPTLPHPGLDFCLLTQGAPTLQPEASKPRDVTESAPARRKARRLDFQPSWRVRDRHDGYHPPPLALTSKGRRALLPTEHLFLSVGVVVVVVVVAHRAPCEEARWGLFVATAECQDDHGSLKMMPSDCSITAVREHERDDCNSTISTSSTPGSPTRCAQTKMAAGPLK